MFFLNSEDFVFRLIRRLTNVIQVDSQIELSDRNRLRKYVDREKGRKSLSSMGQYVDVQMEGGAIPR